MNSSRLKTIIRTMLLGMLLSISMSMPIKAFDNVKQTNATSNSATITWDKTLGEAYYEIELVKISHYWKGGTYYTDTDWVSLGTTPNTTYTFKKLLGGELYSFQITSYDSDGDWIMYKNYSGMGTLPGKVEVYDTNFKWGYAINSIPQYYNLQIRYIGQDTAEGYQIKLMDYKGRKIKTQTAYNNGNQFEYYYITKLKEDVYCLQVRAYTTYKNKRVYGKWSDKIYVLQSPLSKARYTKGKIQIAWDKIKGASGYDVYMCGKKNGTYKKVASVSGSKTSVYVKKYGSSKIKKNKTYYYYIIAKKKSGGKVYKSEISYRAKVRTE